jgi:hypothetical protein
MLAQKPHLHLVAAQNLAHYQIVRTVIAEFARSARQFAGLPDNDSVCL